MKNEYIFILGNNPELAVAEIKALYPQINISQKTNLFLIGQVADFNCPEAIKKLGGTVKIGQVLSNKIDQEIIISEITKSKGESKINYGLSFYTTKPTKMGMAIKKTLKASGISSRLVVSQEKVLSSVIVKKNKVLEFLILPDVLGLTCAVQEFEEYGKRDYGRPKSDAHSGMLPPKLAKMMINLSGAKQSDTILDPFCGSGTVLSEALALGYKNLLGSDLSVKACSDTKDNLNWLAGEYDISDAKFQIYHLGADKLTDKIPISGVTAIITEPYLGPTLQDDERESRIFKIISEVENIYLRAFTEFKKILKPQGRVVLVLPFWHLGGRKFKLRIENKIAALGFTRLDKGDLLYKRAGQRVWRQIEIWETP